jgi:hypothetical protein
MIRARHISRTFSHTLHRRALFCAPSLVGLRRFRALWYEVAGQRWGQAAAQADDRMARLDLRSGAIMQGSGPGSVLLRYQ